MSAFLFIFEFRYSVHAGSGNLVIFLLEAMFLLHSATSMMTMSATRSATTLALLRWLTSCQSWPQSRSRLITTFISRTILLHYFPKLIASHVRSQLHAIQSCASVKRSSTSSSSSSSDSTISISTSSLSISSSSSEKRRSSKNGSSDSSTSLPTSASATG